MIRRILVVPTLALLTLTGCGLPSRDCSKRPWECEKATGTGGATGNCETYVPPPIEALASNPKLPDPFQFADGSRVASRSQWPCRKTEIKAQAAHYELGPNPGAPSSVTGALDGDSGIKVTVTNGDRAIEFTARVTYPAVGEPPFPAMIGIGGISIGESELNELGVATISFPHTVVAENDNADSRGLGAFYQLYPTSQDTGALMAWAWGVSRLIDALEDLPDPKRIDPKRLGVTGCSRNGKGALIVGAFEDRIALTIPQESGAGGSASWRISDAMFATGTEVQTLNQITGENVWFTPSFSRFKGATNKLPFDHHMIEGLVAPRALLVIENTSQVWLGNVSTYNNSMAAHMIWEALGVPNAMGYSQVGDHAHCVWNGSQQSEVTAFVQRFLIGDAGADAAVPTTVLKTDGGFSFEKAKWVDWSVPSL